MVIVKGGLEIVWKEPCVIYFKTLSWCSPLGTEGNHPNLSPDSQSSGFFMRNIILQWLYFLESLLGMLGKVSGWQAP
jgi:hypothetical protein